MINKQTHIHVYTYIYIYIYIYISGRGVILRARVERNPRIAWSRPCATTRGRHRGRLLSLARARPNPAVRPSQSVQSSAGRRPSSREYTREGGGVQHLTRFGRIAAPPLTALGGCTRPPTAAPRRPRRPTGGGVAARRDPGYMRNLLGRLETRLAQIIRITST